jgi:CRP/FNR family transcriptional regulator, anaerobic regulatory protein
MDILKFYFNKEGFNETDIEQILSCFRPSCFNKGDYFVKAGKVSSQIGFIESGLFQYYSLTEDGEERTSYISLPNTFMASLLTYLTETPSRENIRALSNSTLWIIEKSDVFKLQNSIPSFKDFYIKLIEWQICCIDKNRFDLITLTSEQRYEKLIREEPELLRHVPLQYIASMLGMSPRHLSRLRGKI